MNAPLLEIRGLSVHFHTPEGIGRAVESVSLSIAPGETLGLVGESGCGKSVTALAVMGLVPSPPGRIAAGEIHFDGKDLLRIDPESLRRIRGRKIGMIFQEPMTALNPVLTIGRQVAEPLVAHLGLSRTEALKKAGRWLDRVRIPAAVQQLRAYPHELSGGMRQRVMIAMAMICRPRLLVADEPTTALDVTLQRQILSLMAGLKAELDTAMLLITHDLGVVAQTAGRVVVMYAGRVVETAEVRPLFAAPLHPYTRGLLESMPQLGAGRGRLHEIPGTVPAATRSIRGCPFAGRCPSAFDRCRQDAPALETVRPGRRVSCWLYRK
ncbi:ABC transporter ATP-binding protein [Desulfosarcina alkanivorans]|uniref:ABC transporter ATP-binding protein n=1 Tax=Desulfosarcina alkanivorans TaxID=571177 RepID=A0A5K7YNP5_9BACT|nr:ABC transporter ATP-binding protein [Desulfosarcina alkanivorans]BBO70428.1 ABC transporter ATP-binding protein [Desulfosarcina alkanivorans]